MQTIKTPQVLPICHSNEISTCAEAAAKCREQLLLLILMPPPCLDLPGRYHTVADTGSIQYVTLTILYDVVIKPGVLVGSKQAVLP